MQLLCGYYRYYVVTIATMQLLQLLYSYYYTERSSNNELATENPLGSFASEYVKKLYETLFFEWHIIFTLIMSQIYHRKTISQGEKSDIYCAAKLRHEKQANIAAQHGLRPFSVSTIVHNGPYDCSISQRSHNIDKCMELVELKTKEVLLRLSSCSFQCLLSRCIEIHRPTPISFFTVYEDVTPPVV